VRTCAQIGAGARRMLRCHEARGQGVPASNPGIPTNQSKLTQQITANPPGWPFMSASTPSLAAQPCARTCCAKRNSLGRQARLRFDAPCPRLRMGTSSSDRSVETGRWFTASASFQVQTNSSRKGRTKPPRKRWHLRGVRVYVPGWLLRTVTACSLRTFDTSIRVTIRRAPSQPHPNRHNSARIRQRAGLRGRPLAKLYS
jgi:hypothetical protein